ncbi:hypothetical protein KL864_31495 [Mycolicibacterium goodii]|uniref:hypothetical protein n=1 Tax=Mycolicibacterium goodii TaxID=134601 RepID=UPI001BDBBEBA|nr:hypothetical protein [Mycolicibacterium goodii]MBU8820403.1 hypothetical protein [Mycolicibacterium goodii]
MAAAITVAVFIGMVASGCLRSTTVTEGQPAHMTAPIAEDREAWSAAVCTNGSVSKLSSGQIRFPNVENFASCMSKISGAGGGVVPIIIGEWPDEPTMRQDLAHYRMIHYVASAELGDAVIVFAPSGDNSPTTIEPLQQFGFRIEPLH